jgi:hypothetical protein
MKKEIHQGTNGSGETIWHVVTINQSGDWRHMETFKSKAEAECWMKWA